MSRRRGGALHLGVHCQARRPGLAGSRQADESYRSHPLSVSGVLGTARYCTSLLTKLPSSPSEKLTISEFTSNSSHWFSRPVVPTKGKGTTALFLHFSYHMYQARMLLVKAWAIFPLREWPCHTTRRNQVGSESPPPWTLSLPKSFAFAPLLEPWTTCSVTTPT